MHIKVRKSAKQEKKKPNPQKELVDSLVKCTDEELIEKLQSITHWQWSEQDDIYNWADLLNRFDDFLAGLSKYYEKRTVLDLSVPTSEFPRQLLLQVLRFSLLILENCLNRQLYSSVEHLSKLIQSDDTEVVLAALNLLAVYVPNIHQQTMPSDLNTQLFCLAKGWGGKQDGLGLIYCVRQEDVSNKLAVGSTLHFEFYVDAQSADTTSEAANVESVETKAEGETTTTEEKPEKTEEGTEKIGTPQPGLTIIHVPNLHLFKESNLEILELLVKKYNIPRKFHFPLLIRIRLARAFPSHEARRSFIRMNLLAFTILAAQAQMDVSYMNSFFLYEPEFLAELMELVRSDASVPADFRILALKALTALLADTTRLHGLISATGSSQHHGELPSMIRKSVATLTGSVEHPIYTLRFIEALFTFLSSLMATQDGIVALNNAGAIASLLPLLNHTDPRHNGILLKCLMILEYYLSASSTAISSSASMSLFRDLGGLDSLVGRFNSEITEVSKSSVVEAMDVDEGKGKEKVTDTEQQDARLDNNKRTLLKTLGRVILPFVQGGRRRNVGRLTSLIEGQFPASLRFIIKHHHTFGDTIFSTAILLLSGLINNDPTRFAVLQETGLINEFLVYVTSRLAPSASVLLTLSSALSSICLNANGLASVIECNAVPALFSIFTEQKFKKVLRARDIASVIGAGLDELMRHHPTLRPIGVTSAIDLLKRVIALGGLEEPKVPVEESPKPEISTPTTPQQPAAEVSSGENAGEGGATGENANTSPVSVPPTEATTPVEPAIPAFIQPKLQEEVTIRTLEAFINNTATLFETLFVNNEHANAFLKSKGIDLLLSLFRLPKLSGVLNSSCVHALSAAFRTLATQHSADVLKEILACLTLQFDSLDKISSWRDGVGFIKEEDDPAVLSVLGGIDSYAGLLSGMVRDPNGLSTTPFQTLTQWTSGNGVSVSLALGQLQRCILWELASHSYGEKKRAVTEKVEEKETKEEQVTSTPMETDPVVSEQQEKPADGGEGSSSAAKTPAEEKKEPQTKARMIHLVSSIHSLSQGLVRALAEGHRRRDEKVVSGIVQTLAKTLADHLVWNPKGYEAGEVAVKAAYLSSVVGELRSLLFNERNSSTHTLLLHAFNHVDGTAHLLSAFEWIVEVYASLRGKELEKGKDTMDIEKEKEEKGKEKEGQVVTATSEKVNTSTSRDAEMEIVESALLTFGGFLKFLVSGPMLFGSPITASMLTFQSLPGQSGPFDPYTFLAGIQCKVLVSVLPVWNHQLFPQFPPSFITSLLLANNQIMEGEAHSPKPKKEEEKKKAFEVDPVAVLALQEMGFPAEHAAEALRQIGSNSVEMATEWLFNNPMPEPEAQPKALSEEEELAQALAMSLGQELGPAEPEKPKEINYAEQYALLRKGMLEKCLSLISSIDASSSTVSDLLTAMCKKDEDRSVIINSLLEQIKTSAAQRPPAKSLNHLVHVLTRLLLEDTQSRQLVAASGVISTLLSLLQCTFTYRPDDSPADEGEEVPAPKWLHPVFVLLDAQLQLPSAIVVKKQTVKKPKAEPAATVESSAETSVPKEGEEAAEQASKEEKPTEAEEEEETVYDFEVPVFLSSEERNLALEHCTSLLQRKLDTSSLHAVLQLCARLTRNYDLALQFVKQGGLTTLLNLPAESAFSGQTALVSSILRHVLEEPSLLQSVMETEIKSTLNKMSGRGNAPVKPKALLTAVGPLVCRDPEAFLRAATVICRLKDPRPNVPLSRAAIILAPDANQKESKDTLVTPKKSDSAPSSATPSKTPKAKKRAPASFVQVITELINTLYTLSQLRLQASEQTPTTEKEPSRKGKEKETTKEATPAVPSLTAADILAILTDYINAYPPCSTVVLRHRVGKSGKSKRGGKGKQKENEATGVNSVISFILRELIPYPKDSNQENEQKQRQENVAAANMLATLAQRPEGRKRIITELTQAMELQVKEKSKEEGYPHALQALVDFLFLLLTTSASQTPVRPNAVGVLGDVARLMLDANTISILTKALHSIDLNHPDAIQLVSAILKPLEVLTRITTVISPKKTEKEKKAETEEQSPVPSADTVETTTQPTESTSAASEEATVETHDADEGEVDGEGDADGGEGASEEDPQILGGSSLGDLLNRSGGQLLGELGSATAVVDRLFEAMAARSGQPDLNALMEMTMGYIGEQARAQLAQEHSDSEGEDIDEGEGEERDDEGDEEDGEEDDGREDEIDDLESESSSDEEDEFSFGGPLLPPEPPLGIHIGTTAPGGTSFTISMDDLLGRRADARAPAQPRHFNPFTADASLDTNPLFSTMQPTDIPQEPSILSTLRGELSLDARSRLMNRLSRPGRPGRGGQWADEPQKPPTSVEFVNSFEEILVETLRKISLAELREKEAKEKVEREAREKATKEKAEQEAKEKAEREAKEQVEREEKEKAEQEAKEKAEQEAKERAETEGEKAGVAPMETTPTEVVPAEQQAPVEAPSVTTTTPSTETPPTAESAPRVMPELVPDQPTPVSTEGPSSEAGTTMQATSEGTPSAIPEGTPAVPAEGTTTTTAPAPTVEATPQVGPLDVGLLETAGIDPAFLAALPDDLRAEVLASQVPQLGRPTASSPPPTSSAPSAGVSTSTINPDFIAALPPDIQLEMLQEEQRQQAAVADISRAEQMSTADFFATLSPALREEILMTQDPSIINQLPPDIAAEAANLRERAFNQFRGGGRRVSGLGAPPSWGGPMLPRRAVGGGGPFSIAKEKLASEGPSFTDFAGKAPLEEGDLVTLVRLLYLAKPLAAKGLLHKLFLNLSSHSDTRLRLLQMMLSILNACLAARSPEIVDTCLGPSDRPFAEVLAQLPVVPSSSEFSPLEDPCHSLLSPGVMSAYTHSGEHPPSLVSRRILEILCHLAKSNPRVAEYVLGIKKETEKETGEEGKEKEKEEKELSTEVCPLAKLMDLLGVPQFHDSSAQLAHLLQFLALSVRPLARIKEEEERQRKAKEEREKREQEEKEKKLQKEQENRERAEREAAEAAANQPPQPPSPALTTPSETTTPTETAPTPMEVQTESATSAPIPAETPAETPAATPAETPAATSAETTEGTTTTAGETEKEKEVPPKPVEEVKPAKKAEDLCPVIPEGDLAHLVNVLTLDHLAEQTYNHATSVLGSLSINVKNREALQEKLTRAAQGMAEVVMHNLRVLQEEFESSVNATILISMGSSSHEVNLLRIIKTIIALPASEGMQSSEVLLASLELEPLWDALEACLTILNEQNEKEKSKAKARALEESDGKGKEKEKDKKKKGEKTSSPAATLLLPVIEVFFVVNGGEPLPIKRSVSSLSLESLGLLPEAKDISLSSSKSISRSGSLYNLAGLQSRFVAFAERNRNLLNDLVRENPTLLHGTFKVLLRWPRALEFDNKLLYFRGELQKLKESSRGYGCRLQVRRKRIFEDSFSQLRNRTAEELRGRLSIRFADEEGIDAGGVTRDWFDILAKEMFNANYGLFIATAQDNSTFQPNRLSYINPDHIQYFKVVGRIIGKAIFDGHYLPCHFTRSFYKHMLGATVLPNDMEAIDPEYYKNLKWILENDVNESGLDLTFSLEIDDFGTMKNVELKPGGKSIAVTEENKVEYVQLVTQMKMTTSIHSQIEAFLDGFHEIIPKDLISIFNEMELELLISGLPEIDMEDLRRNTEYSGFSESSPAIQWFWKAVNSFDQEEKAKLLQFVTGTSRVPLDGFTALRGISGPQKFQIHKAYRTDSLPAAHTCFNQLDLPEYETYEQLRESLLYAIRETEGFGFG